MRTPSFNVQLLDSWVEGSPVVSDDDLHTAGGCPVRNERRIRTAVNDAVSAAFTAAAAMTRPKP